MTATPHASPPGPGGWPAAAFNWNLKGRVIAIDNGAVLARRNDFAELMALGALSVITFDPASHLHGAAAPATHPEFQLFNGVGLGNGAPARLYACLDPAFSASLAPLPAARLPGNLQNALQVLARLPLNTLKLDSIEGLSSVDWLILDDRHDSLGILEHAHSRLESVLLAQLGCSFLPCHEGAADFGQLCHRMAQHGLAFYRFNSPQHLSRFPATLQLNAPRSSQLHSAQALFVPTQARLEQMAPARRLKLAFIVDSAYGLHDLAYHLLASVDQGQATTYLAARHYLAQVEDLATTFTLTAQYSPAPW